MRISPFLLPLIVILIALFRDTQHHSTPNTIDWYAQNKTVTIEGTIVEEPDRRPLQTKYTIDVHRIIDNPLLQPEIQEDHRGISGRILVNDYRKWPEYAFGETVQVTGVLEKPVAIEEFRYDHYLSRYGIYAIMYYATSIQKVKHPTNPQKEIWRSLLSSTRSMLYVRKHAFERQINRLLPEPHASFMAGLLTGSRRGIPEHLTKDFASTGLTHIIAISGYNITIIITIVSSILFWIPRTLRFVPICIAIIGFTVFVGSSAAVVRAAIMGILGLLAMQGNRQIPIRLSILWTAAIMILWNPKIFWYDAGFQLSFLAVLGLVEIAPLLQPLFRRVPNVLAIQESLQMTVAAQIFAVPLIIVLFGQFSLIAPVANVLVAPLIPLAMLSGFIGTICSMISFSLGQVIMLFGWGCLEIIILAAQLCASIPLASISFSLHPLWLIPYYLIVLTCILYQTKSIRTTKQATHTQTTASPSPST